MKKFSITSLEDGLEYCGEVESVRQTYHVFAANRYYFMLCFSKTRGASGNFNIVPKALVDYVRSEFAGQKNVTARDVSINAENKKNAPDALSALNVLYVMVALGQAQITDVGERQQLLFKISK